MLEYKRTGGPLNPKPLAGSGQTNSGLPDCEEGEDEDCKDEDCDRRLKGIVPQKNSTAQTSYFGHPREQTLRPKFTILGVSLPF